VAVVRIIDKDTNGEKLNFEDEMHIIHGMGRLPIKRDIRAGRDIKEDIHVQVQLYIAGVPGEAVSESFELGHFYDWLLGDLE